MFKFGFNLNERETPSQSNGDESARHEQRQGSNEQTLQPTVQEEMPAEEVFPDQSVGL